MINFFLAMTYLSTIVAQLTSVIFCIGIFLKRQSLSDISVFDTCNNQIKVCRVSSVIFAVLYWFVVSGLSTAECMACYKIMADTCFRLGCIWIVFAFLNIVISVIFGILKRGKDELKIMEKLRGADFVTGAFFLVIAFILKVD